MLLAENTLLCLGVVSALIWALGTRTTMVAVLAVNGPSPPIYVYCMLALTVLYNMEKDLQDRSGMQAWQNFEYSILPYLLPILERLGKPAAHAPQAAVSQEALASGA